MFEFAGGKFREMEYAKNGWSRWKGENYAEMPKIMPKCPFLCRNASKIMPKCRTKEPKKHPKPRLFEREKPGFWKKIRLLYG